MTTEKNFGVDDTVFIKDMNSFRVLKFFKVV